MSIALLANKAVWERATPISIEAYHLLHKEGLISEKTELLEGVVIEKMPKDPIHAELVRRIYEYIKNKTNFKVLKEDPISTGFSEPEPDIAIVPLGDYSKSHPKEALVVIEVANTSLGIDRAKAPIYAKANIPEYIIMNLQNNILEYYSKPSEGNYSFTKIFQKDEYFSSTSVPEVAFKLDDFLG